ncbi:DUF4270 domain-containing protein [uncultured Algibacter sp.]|uniref:DUF4270 domain-containing protein n=1 Tax=uncultured Algibacter sp. TaxID=298659 RepID=UPI00261A927A|nr:DUF4270 domain-containing protein [uncultured Algibacter sp.]
MKNKFKALKFPIIITLFLSSFIACDKDFSVIESDVLGEENAHFSTGIDTLPISAYNKKLSAVQVNNLASNLLGVFNDLEFGKSTASIVTQITPNSSSLNPNFGVDPVIDSVVINIPYFSTVTGPDDLDPNASKYNLDSVYGDIGTPFKLTIYKNNYFLKDFEGRSTQNYYSKSEGLDNPSHNYALNGSEEIDFDNHLGEMIYENSDFKPRTVFKKLLEISGTDTIVTYAAPALRIKFDSEITEDEDKIRFWQQTIIEKGGEPELSSVNDFRAYFRGLYFKAEAIENGGNMFLINLESSEANITIYYKNGEESEKYVMDFTGNKLNTFKNEFSAPLADGDKDNGDETLYLKGLSGSMAVVDLFNGLVEYTDNAGNISEISAVDYFKKTYRKTNKEGNFIYDDEGNYVLKRLINEAHLTIYEDESKVINTVDEKNGDAYHKYDRIYAYDIKNNLPTIDYQFDGTENNDPIFSKIFSLEQRDSISPTEAKYKIRITEHLNNIIQNDSTNYKIGLVLSNNVNYINNSGILNSNDDVTAVPSASVISPRGTILYGSNEAIDALDVNGENKRLTLKIFYTETETKEE